MKKITITKNIEQEVNILKMIGMKPNYTELGKIYKIDPRTVKKYFEKENYEENNHRNKHSKLEEYDEIIREKIAIPGTKIISVYDYLVDVHEYGGSYSSLTNYIRIHDIRKPSKQTGKVLYETNPGEQLQFDWVESITMINKYGDEIEFNVFSAELSYSRMHYFKYSKTKTKEDVIKCLMSTFEYFNGTPKSVLTDNMSSIVHDGKFCEEFKAFAKDFDIELNKCKVRHSWTKGKVEVRNKFINRLKPYNNEFETEEDIEKILNKIINKINDTVNSRTGVKPIMLYQKEKEYLTPLPSKEIRDYYLDLKIALKVTNVSTIIYKGCQYSVPARYINKTLKVKEIDNNLYIYNNTELITKHEINGNKINYTEEHYKECLRKSMPDKDDDFIEKLAKKNLKAFDNLSKIRKEIKNEI